MAMKPLKVEIKTAPHVLGYGKVTKATIEITSNDGEPFDFNIEGTLVGDNGLGDLDRLQIFAAVQPNGDWTRVHIFRDNNGTHFVEDLKDSGVSTGSDEMTVIKVPAGRKRSSGAPSGGIALLRARNPQKLIDPASETELLSKFHSGLLQFQADLKPNLGKDALRLKEIDFREYSVDDLIRVAFNDSNKAWYPAFLFGSNPTVKNLPQVKDWAEKNKDHYFAKGVLKK